MYCIVWTEDAPFVPSCALLSVVDTGPRPDPAPPRPPPRPAEGLLPTYLEVQWYYILLHYYITSRLSSYAGKCSRATCAPQYFIVCSNHRASIVAFMLLVTYWITHKKGGLKKYLKKVCIFANKNLNKTLDLWPRQHQYMHRMRSHLCLPINLL